MARRFQPQSTTKENIALILRSPHWRALLIAIALLLLGIPTFIYGLMWGNSTVTGVTNMFTTLSNISNKPTPTPQPTYPKTLPQAGMTHYTVQEGDNCNAILAYHMRMFGASEVFSDAEPNTIKALNKALGQECSRLQPGMVLSIAPQYPLVAMGGKILKIESTVAQQVLPTPLIPVPQEEYTPDCTGGCALTVQITPDVKVRLIVRSSLAIREGSWTWFQAAVALKNVPGFKKYPYTDSTIKWNGMTLRACDFQVDSVKDDGFVSCDELKPNTFEEDGGTWLYAVTGPNGINHWNYKLKSAPVGTSVLVWLDNQGGRLVYRPGDPAYRYDDASQLYVKW